MSALLTQARRKFERYGTTLTAWCRDQGVNRSDARSALTGRDRGAQAAALRQRIVGEAAARARRPMRGVS